MKTQILSGKYVQKALSIRSSGYTLPKNDLVIFLNILLLHPLRQYEILSCLEKKTISLEKLS